MSLHERLARHAIEQPGRVALACPSGELDYAGLLCQVAAAMRVLRDARVDVLALDLDNCPAWVVLDIAALSLGICLVPLPPFFSASQLRHVVGRAGVQAVVTDNPSWLRQRLGAVLEDDDSLLPVAGQRLGLVRTAPAQPLQGASLAAGVHKITFTSGTTGEPKGVMLGWPHVRPTVVSLAEAAGITADDRHLSLMPLAVLLENIAGVYASLWAGGTVVLLPMEQVGLGGSSRLEAGRMALALAATRASTAIFTPQTLQGVVEALELRRTTRLSLRFAAVGGAPVSARLLQRAADLRLPVFEGYGLSECASVVCLNTPANHRAGSVGKPLPHVRLDIAGDGEVVIEGNTFAGYLGEDAAAPQRWPTGDIGELDEDGYLHLRGRRRNIFITAFGRNVAPEWVERELTLEPAIAQAAVFGEARAHNVAVICAAAGATPVDIEAALARANELLPDYARVSGWVAAETPFTVANGLLTGTGRPRRAALLERYGAAIESFHQEAPNHDRLS